MPNAASRWATSAPIRPRPSRPATFWSSSAPVNSERFHSPALSEAIAWGTLRATASSSPTACSAALTMFELGALTTITPAAVAASTSTLSRPTPARATTRSPGACASASASILVELRMITASAPASAGSSAARSAPSAWRTSKSASSWATAAGDSSSATSTTGFRTVLAFRALTWDAAESSRACECFHELAGPSSSAASQLISGRSRAPTCSICSACRASRRLRKFGRPLSNSSTSSR